MPLARRCCLAQNNALVIKHGLMQWSCYISPTKKHASGRERLLINYFSCLKYLYSAAEVIRVYSPCRPDVTPTPLLQCVVCYDLILKLSVPLRCQLITTVKKGGAVSNTSRTRSQLAFCPATWRLPVQICTTQLRNLPHGRPLSPWCLGGAAQVASCEHVWLCEC